MKLFTRKDGKDITNEIIAGLVVLILGALLSLIPDFYSNIFRSLKEFYEYLNLKPA